MDNVGSAVGFHHFGKPNLQHEQQAEQTAAQFYVAMADLSW